MRRYVVKAERSAVAVTIFHRLPCPRRVLDAITLAKRAGQAARDPRRVRPGAVQAGFHPDGMGTERVFWRLPIKSTITQRPSRC